MIMALQLNYNCVPLEVETFYLKNYFILYVCSYIFVYVCYGLVETATLYVVYVHLISLSLLQWDFFFHFRITEAPLKCNFHTTKLKFNFH